MSSEQQSQDDEFNDEFLNADEEPALTHTFRLRYLQKQSRAMQCEDTASEVSTAASQTVSSTASTAIEVSTVPRARVEIPRWKQSVQRAKMQAHLGNDKFAWMIAQTTELPEVSPKPPSTDAFQILISMTIRESANI